MPKLSQARNPVKTRNLNVKDKAEIGPKMLDLCDSVTDGRVFRLRTLSGFELARSNRVRTVNSRFNAATGHPFGRHFARSESH